MDEYFGIHIDEPRLLPTLWISVKHKLVLDHIYLCI